MNELTDHRDTQDKTGDLEAISGSTQLLGAALLLLLVAVISWASWSQLDVVSIASGSIVPTTKVQKVQHLEGGIIDKIEVREGDRVVEGQAMIILSAKVNAAEVQEFNLRIQSLEGDSVRLMAESSGAKKLIFSEEFKAKAPEVVARANDLFRVRGVRLQTDLTLQRSEMRLFSEQIEELKQRLKNNKERLVLVKEQVKIGEDLLKNKLSNRYEQIERLKEVNTLRSEIDNAKAAIKRSKTGLIKAKTQLKKIQGEFDESVQSDLSLNRQSLDEFRTRVSRFEDSLQRTILRAPVTGVVKRLYVETEGGVVRAGETLLEIVPGDDLLIVEAQLPPQDIGHVEVGQAAFVQLDAPDSASLGKIQGVVKHISPDSLVTAEGIAYYVVNIAVEKTYFGTEQDQVVLFPGMIVSTGIILGKRSVLDYILSPFTRNASFVFSEQ